MPLLSPLKTSRPTNRSRSKSLGLTWLISIILLIVVSSTMILTPSVAQKLWPWPLAPFNTAFFGIVYFSAALPLISYLFKPHPSLLKVILPTFVCFTTSVCIVSCVHHDSFLDRRSTDVWFWLYGADCSVGLWSLWRNQNLIWNKENPSAQFSRLYWGQSIILGLYGLCNLFFPKTFGQMWSWPLDAFQTHLYSSVFISASVAMILLLKHGNAMSRLIFSSMQICMGFGTAFSTWGIDQNIKKLDWSTLHPWLWQFIFIGFGVAGLRFFYQGFLLLQHQRKSRS